MYDNNVYIYFMYERDKSEMNIFSLDVALLSTAASK